ncbi:MAG TPA: amino acid ABC transporter permease [Candidatus Limnocylindrales bacterium]|nr:amino acid ABC transporter permease [Candidatus Limnocylindrales bacterium]
MFGRITLDNFEYFVQGYLTTIALSVGAMAVALVIGAAVASLRVWGGRVPSSLGVFYVEFFRNTPLLIQLFFFAVVLAPRNLGITAEPFVVALIGLSLYTGAFATEAIRSGILAIDPGQVEAARSLGLSQLATIRLVVLPQAIRTVVPPLGNVASALIRNSSVASAIGTRELLFMGLLVANRTFSLEPLVGVLLGYWSLTLTLSLVLARLERRLAFAR